MRRFRLIFISALTLTLAAILAPSASGSLLPGTAGTTIKGSSSKVTLQVKGGASVTCKASETTGEVSSSEAMLLLMTFNECTSGGLPTNSIGDGPKTILAHIEAGSCSRGSIVYILFATLPIKLEVPAVKGLKLEVTGSVLGKVTPESKKTKEFNVEFLQKEGEQFVGPSECQNSKKETIAHIGILTSTNGGSSVQSGVEAVLGKLVFSAEQEYMV